MSKTEVETFFDALFAAMKILSNESQYFSEKIQELPETQEAITGCVAYYQAAHHQH